MFQTAGGVRAHSILGENTMSCEFRLECKTLDPVSQHVSFVQEPEYEQVYGVLIYNIDLKAILVLGLQLCRGNRD